MESATHSFQPPLIAPYGGTLVNLTVAPEERDDLKEYASQLPSFQLHERAVCDLEVLATGGFSPLTTFMGQKDYRQVLEEMRLADGTLFPIPVTLPLTPAPELRLGQDITLRDAMNNILAVLSVREIFDWDLAEEAGRVIGSTNPRHPLTAEMSRWGSVYVSGRLRVLELPAHFDFTAHRLTPAETRARLAASGCANVVAFQTRNPLHRVHEELTKRAMQRIDGSFLLHPVVGMTRPGDVDHFTRVRTYTALLAKYYPPARVHLSLLPLAMRMAGPREALWHMLIRRNCGANHMIVGRDHAGPGPDSEGRPFYGPFEAQALAEAHSAEIGVQVVPFDNLVYLVNEDRYEEESQVPPTAKTYAISGTMVREEYLGKGKLLPQWYTRPEVAEILKESYPALHRQGICLWFTGLSGSGKSTTANILIPLLMEKGRRVTLLDGDVVRTHLSRGLGFSKTDRDLNIRRIGFVSAEIVRHSGAVIASAVSPFRATRNDVRNLVGPDNYIEIFVDTPLDVCEARDAKGMYKRARRGEIKHFTGVDDPYEVPHNPEITLNAVDFTPMENAQRIMDYLRQRGFIA